MKRSTKSFLLTALILFCAGILLTLGSFLFVKIRGINPYGVEDSLKTPESKTVTLDEIMKQSPNANFAKGTAASEFSKIEATSFSGKLVILPTDGKTYLDLKETDTQNLSCEVIGETLIIRDTKTVGQFGFFINENGFTFHGLRQIFGPGNFMESKRVVTIYVDRSASVSEISATSMVGDVTVDGVSVGNLKVMTNFGNVKVKNCTVTEGKINVEGSVSNVEVADNHSVYLSVSVKFGNIDAYLTTPETASSNLDVWLGNVRVRSAEPFSLIKLYCETKMGAVYLNGDQLGKAVQPSTDLTNSVRRVSSSAIFGSIYFDDLPDAKPFEPIETGEPEETVTDTVESTDTHQEAAS